MGQHSEVRDLGVAVANGINQFLRRPHGAGLALVLHHVLELSRADASVWAGLLQPVGELETAMCEGVFTEAWR